ncbi:hypothetical protein HPB50_018687 [Hyalomma asiaticum]|uniref:Uncharacterized protein n=1 Tax=Hyalomma asiaticum TaxID=266040 RepID=A0ACB7SIW6_HYAAI|nr:hypothetical protein HPB50_018687 [Hyalomma asiaticum]
MSDAAIKGGGHDVFDVLDSPKSDAKSHGSDSSVHSLQPLTPSSSQRHPRKVYGRRPMELVQPALPSRLRSPGVYGSKTKYKATPSVPPENSDPPRTLEGRHEEHEIVGKEEEDLVAMMALMILITMVQQKFR